MNILLVVHQFFPDYGSGTEVLTRSVARELMARGHEVHVLTGYPETQALSDEDRCDEYDYEGIHVYRFRHAYTPMGGQTSSIALGYDNHLAARYFGGIVQRFRPNLVHFFHLNRLGTGLIDQALSASVPAYFTPTDFWALCPTAQMMLDDGRHCSGPSTHAGNCISHFALAAKGANSSRVSTVAKYVPISWMDTLSHLTTAGLMPPYPFKHEVRAMAGRLPTNVARLNQLQKIVTPTDYMRDLLLRHGVLPHKVVKLPFGIETSQNLLTTRCSNPSKPLRVGYIGTLATHKGCHVLLDAFKLLPAGQATLQIYGSLTDFPAYAAELMRSASDSEHVSFCGVFPNEAIATVLAGIDVLVVPSLWFENTPLVIHSAQAARCPVVGSDHPGISEAIEHEANGLLFAAGNTSALAEQLLRLIADRSLLHAMSERSRAPPSIAHYVEALIGIWQDQDSSSSAR